ncbi:hypothetical protein [Streptomyces sp. NBC_01235]|uniref:hypothetical protein n=1 Tax=Streptomyces sp. NBC_01235 TaxID=2903788 RepID=UPI002E0FC025|nr:hypothetical protein OG289_05545 [Streptomyces sp. NBC_01235]
MRDGGEADAAGNGNLGKDAPPGEGGPHVQHTGRPGRPDARPGEDPTDHVRQPGGQGEERPEAGPGALRPVGSADHARQPGERQEDQPEAEPGDRPPVGSQALPGGRRRLLARLRKHRLLTSAVALALLATATAVPIVLLGSGGDTPCQKIPSSTRALVRDPAAATRALDPGDDLARLDAVRTLLVHEHPCGDGGRVLGEVVDAATRATGTENPHTLAQARSAFAVAAALNEVELPDGMAPGVARMLSQYIVDQHRYGGSDKDAVRPAVPADLTAPDDEGWTTYGRFLAPEEAHADFEHTQPYSDVEADPERLVAELAKDPQAFAILYAAERAWLAYYLERLDGQGRDPGYHPKPSRDGFDTPDTYWVDSDLEHMADRVGALMKYRARYARDGTIPDVTAFDATVRRYTRGVYLAHTTQETTRPPMAGIAARYPSGRVRGDLMDARHQLLRVVDFWATARRIPKARAAALRQVIDDRYVRALWLTI